ncbi:MAG: gliding motility-associated protein GldE [Bacteroidota bacterium]|nr:gliding motility-associated protein GldE [Bacteroidota bacterium]
MHSDFFQIIITAIVAKPITYGAIAGIIAVLILLFSSAMVSGSEVAFFSLRPADIKKLKESEAQAGKLILLLLKKPERLLASILIANNFINIGIVILSAYITDNLLDFPQEPVKEFIFQIVVITFILLLFGEVIPKVYSTHAGIKFAQFTAFPIYITSRLLVPFSSLLQKSTGIVEHRMKKKKNISVEELSEAIEIAGSEIRKDKKILEGIVTFGNIDVKEIMRPRIDIVGADIKVGFRELVNVISYSGFSRVPVYDETPDNIKGIIFAKDILQFIDYEDSFKWQELIKKPYYVPESMKINNLLQEFQVRKIHMAIVSNEYGGVLGLVTMEDIIEEIVGEITDETDDTKKNVIQTGANTYEFDAKLQINDFYKVFDIREDIFSDIRGESDSIAGFILELKRRIPIKGELITFKGYNFKILEADTRRIIRIELTVK